MGYYILFSTSKVGYIATVLMYNLRICLHIMHVPNKGKPETKPEKYRDHYRDARLSVIHLYLLLFHIH
jgi:hypothetical protein